MTGRERLTRVYRGELADRVPWAPYVDKHALLTYNETTQKKGPNEFIRAIGGDILGRCSVHKEGVNNNVVKSIMQDEADPSIRHREYRTKLGSVKGTYSTKALTYLEPLLKTPKCFKIWKYIYEGKTFIEDNNIFFETEKEIGEDGITAVYIAPTPVQSLVQGELGVEAFSFALYDYPSELEDLMECMHRKNIEMYKLVAKSPAEFVILVENTSTSMISPDTYSKYSMGHVKDFVNIMHENGKIAIIHMCGLIKNLLPLIKETGLDAIDCLAPPPTGDVDFTDAYRIIGNHLTIHSVMSANNWIPCSVSVDKIKDNIHDFLKPEIINKPFVFCTGTCVPREFRLINLMRLEKQ